MTLSHRAAVWLLFAAAALALPLPYYLGEIEQRPAGCGSRFITGIYTSGARRPRARAA